MVLAMSEFAQFVAGLSECTLTDDFVIELEEFVADDVDAEVDELDEFSNCVTTAYSTAMLGKVYSGSAKMGSTFSSRLAAFS